MTVRLIPHSKPLLIISLWALLAIASVAVMHPGRAAAACAAQNTSRGYVTSTVHIGTAGTYRVWSRIMAPDTTNNSYILEIDGTTCGVVVGDSSSIPANTWTWVDYQSGTTTNKINVTLAAGDHTVTMIGREDNVALDRVVFTTDTNCVPTGTGDNCASPPDTTAPTVSITAPTAGASIQGTVNVTANASDDSGTVAKVEFYVDGALKATDTALPYSYGFDTTSVANGSHSIVAKAYDPTGNSAASTVAVTVNNPAVCKSGSSTLPTTPGSLTKTASDYTSITFSWSASTPSPGCSITGYKIYRNGTLLKTLGNVTSYADSNLNSSTSYNYNVQSIDSGSNSSAESAQASFVTATDNQGPSVPANPTASVVSPSSINITWTASVDLPNPGGVGVNGYNIYRNGATTPTYTVNAGTTSYTDTNVVAGTKYSYTIAAFDKNNNPGAPSTVVSATTPAATCSGKPTAPTALHSTSQGLTTISFAWSASSVSSGCTLAGYHVYRNGTYVGDSSGTATSYNDGGLTVNTSYSYAVAAFDTSSNASAQSSPVIIATLADTTNPSAPGSVTATAVSSGLVTVSWTAATDNIGVGGYKIYRGGTLLATVASSKLSYNDTTVSPSTDYSYQVSAFDTSNNPSASVAATPNPVRTPAATDTTPPSAPTNPTAPVVATQQVQIAWSASSDNVGVAGYHIKINGVPDTFDGDATNSNFTFKCLAPNVSYTFSITAFDAAGNPSAPVTVTAHTLAGGLAGDYDCNSHVNFTDLTTLARNYSATGAANFLPTQGDSTGDAKVNFSDLTDLARNYGK